ncbi:hypothetical protein BCR34DRAFT_591900 [Clohesyomyces aquaticus]|uniref:Rrn9 domain-containing protein n=1 Tax=Clohesyomyces aquaticus TaxID=1231657 RepID=A0A1Y1YWW7_9PLEO|nr:hypothetical protein BCR34DRAFT_591900 [Clohesyomyces aquaticus]
MSLFGGDSANDDTRPNTDISSSDENESIADLAPTASRTTTDDFENAQQVVASPDDYDEDYGTDYYTEEEVGEEESELEEISRPNRFSGKASTWRGYTSAERQVAASLDRLESGDLATHLYNSHALKRRARLPAEELLRLKEWQGRDQWMKKGKALQFTGALGEVQTQLVPSKRWTAWPVVTEKVIHQSERFRLRPSVVEGDEWVIGGLGEQEVGDEMREEVLATFLRLAKDKWESRSPESPTANSGIPSRAESHSKRVSTEQGLSYGSKLKSDEPDTEVRIGANDISEQNSTQRTSQERKFAHILSEGRAESRCPSVKPVFLADDDKARRILQPTINSLLARVDELAITIRRTRMNQFGRGAHSDTSGSEAMTDVEYGSRSSRSVSRSVPRSAAIRGASTRASSRAVSTLAAKKGNRRDYERISDDDHTHGNDPDYEAGDLRPPKRAPKRARRDSNSHDSGNDSSIDWEPSSQVGLLDWSEVIGLAAMTGWNDSAVARTAQRCAALFDESMSFRPFTESLAAKTDANVVHYTPATISVPQIVGILPSPKRPFFAQGTLRCPHANCWGHTKDFEIHYRTVEHVMRIHGYDPRTNDSDNEERKHGAVHEDGFLKPITAKKGWLGAGRYKSWGRKKPKKKKNGDSPPE